MMKPSELRIGNLIYKNLFGNEEIFEITKGYEIDGADDVILKYNPIPLTEEWLLKFGFEKGDQPSWIVYTIGVWFCLIVGKSTKIICFCIDGMTEIEIKYVHTLQNIFFALTGTELVKNN